MINKQDTNSAQSIDKMMNIFSALIEVLKKENEFLADMKIQATVDLITEKLNLLALLEVYKQQVDEGKLRAQDISQEKYDNIRELEALLKEFSQENMNLLNRASAANKKAIEVIMFAFKDHQKKYQGYNEDGLYASKEQEFNHDSDRALFLVDNI
jgi:flagellar biosynthesis/type III secretory pathway chaperone